jgi:hypothetical protein
MVHILVTGTYPAHKGQEMVNIYLSGKQPKYPDFIKKIQNWIVMDNEVKVYAVYEAPDDKIYEIEGEFFEKTLIIKIKKGFEKNERH